MANYMGCTKSNSFKLKECMEEYAKNILSSVYSGDELYFEFGKNEDGFTFCSFCCYGEIYGLPDNWTESNQDSDEYEDADMDLFLKELQKIVSEDSYILIVDSESEKLGCVGGGAYVVTSTDISYMNIWDVAKRKAEELIKK